MSDATEKLRALLDERGVEWKEPVVGRNLDECTNVALENVIYRFREYDGAFDVEIEVIELLTPEQAIAATLGSKVNEHTIDRWLRDFQLSNGNFTEVDGQVIEKLWPALHDDIPLGYEASMRLADWLRVYMLGSGTCHWEYPQNTLGWNGIVKCSNCGHRFDGNKISESDWKCCPICCAKVVDA